MASSWDDLTSREAANREAAKREMQASVEEPVTTEPLPPDEPEGIRRIRVDAEDKLAFRVGVNFLTLVILGVLIWGIVLYIRAQG